MMITSIIVDDEPRAIHALKVLIKRHCNHVKIVAEAFDITTAEQLISEHRPTVVFLDIRMSGGSGLELLQKMQLSGSKVVFVTAHQEHLLEALRLQAFDYLYKPIDYQELINVINRLQIEQPTIKKASPLPTQDSDRIAVSSLNDIRFIDIADILFLAADKNYTVFHTVDGEKFISSKPLGSYEKVLEPYGFFRIHRSNLVGLHHIREYRKKNMQVVLFTGESLDVSRFRKDELISLLTKIS